MTVTELKIVVSETMSLDENDFDMETNLRTLPGFDSVNMLMLFVELEEQANLHFPADQAAHFCCFRQVIDAARQQGLLEE